MSSRPHSHGQRPEPFLEPILARMRYRRSLARIGQEAVTRPITGLDLACGYHGSFVRLANAIPGVRYLGADLHVDPSSPELFPLDLRSPREIDLRPDVITMHAVLEHLEDPGQVVAWVHTLLSPGGLLLATAPSKASQSVLEFLAFRLGLVSREEIEDHKHYFDCSSLEALILSPGGPFAEFTHRYFQLGMNNWVIAHKGPEG